MSGRKPTGPSEWAQRLGYGGLIPFVALALAIWLVPPALQTVLASALVAYGATILSFVGALHWGLTMRTPSTQSAPALVWGVVPSLVAWAALLLPPAAGLLAIAAMLWVCFAVDRKAYPPLGLQAWLPMRFLLTAVASVCCVAGSVRWMG